MSDHMQAWISFSDVFSGEIQSETLQDIVALMELEPALRKLAIANGSISNPDIPLQHDQQIAALDQLDLTEETKQAINELLRRNNPAWILNRRNLLELLKWLGKYANGDNLVGAPDQFLRAAMMAGELATQRHDSLLERRSGEDSRTNIRRCLPAIREMSLLGYPGWHFRHSLGRAKLLLLDDLFENNAKYVESFKANTGLTLDEFFTCIAGVVLLGLGYYQDGGYRFVFTIDNLCAARPIFRPVLEKFFSKFSISIEEIRTELENLDLEKFYDFKLFRSKPIIRFSDETFMVLDQIFFQDLMSSGPMFQSLGSKPRDVFSAFGMAFERYAQRLFEEFHARMVDRKLESSSLYKKLEIARGAGKNRELSDITLFYKNDLVLLEAKGVWLKDDKLNPMDPKIFLDEIHNKYGVTEVEGRKGVGQLADSIKALADGYPIKTTESVTISIETVETIYPVLLVHDLLLTAQGYIPHALAIDFATLFELPDVPGEGSFRYEGKGGKQFKIMNLIVVTIADLERLAAARLNNFSFLYHLREFSRKDGFRFRLTFDEYLQRFQMINPDWFLPEASSNELLRKAAKNLISQADH